MKRNTSNIDEVSLNEAALINESLDQILNLMLDVQDPKNKELISQIFGAIKLSEAIGNALSKVDKSIYSN